MGRVQQGFHRLGLAIAIPTVLIGLLGAIDSVQNHRDFTVTTVFIVIAALLYVACWSIGWVIAGFAR